MSSQTKLHRILRFKAKAGTLLLTLIVSIILYLITVSYLTVGHYNSKFRIRESITSKLDDNINSSIKLALFSSYLNNKLDSSIKLFSDYDDSAFIRKFEWGVFEGFNITVKKYNYKKNISFMYGDVFDFMPLHSLYLADHNRILSIAGRSNISNKMSLPQQGVRMAYIDQNSSIGFDIENLNITNSKESLPLIDSNTLRKIKYLLSLSKINKIAKENSKIESVVNSFYLEPTYVFKKGKILPGERIYGNVIVISDTTLQISSSAQLYNCIIIAPSVKIENSFKGKLQIFASDSIFIGDNAKLEYPSVIALFKDSIKMEQGFLSLGFNTSFSGAIMALSEGYKSNKVYAEFKKNGYIEGIVYVNGYLDLNKDINGLLLTDYFLFKNGSSVYENYLKDVSLSRQMLSKYFISPPNLFTNSRKKIIEWLE